MTPYFDIYHWSKNTVHGCQNTVQGCKMAFDNHFLITPIEVALSSRDRNRGQVPDGSVLFDFIQKNLKPV